MFPRADLLSSASDGIEILAIKRSKLFLYLRDVNEANQSLLLHSGKS